MQLMQCNNPQSHLAITYVDSFVLLQEREDGKAIQNITMNTPELISVEAKPVPPPIKEVKP